MITPAYPAPIIDLRYWLPRLPAALALSLLVTAALLLLMQTLIATHAIQLKNGPSYTVNIVKPRKMEPLVPKPHRLLKPEPPDPRPVTPTPQFPTAGKGTVPGLHLKPLKEVPTDINPGLADGSFMALVRVQPVYPLAAMRRGLEGYTVVVFDLGADGSVHNPRIVEHSPGSVFDNASLKAIKRFRFKPTVVDGTPVPVKGVTYRFSFRLSRAAL